jgi:adenine-specific DNA-methyltransferase
MQKHIADGDIICSVKFTLSVKKTRDVKYNPVFSVWTDGRYNAGTHGTSLLYTIFGQETRFSYPKSLYTVKDCIKAFVQNKPNALIIDFFAGSGTTGYVAGYLNRRYILVEQLEDTVAIMHRRFRDSSPVYCELAAANSRFVAEIAAASNGEELSEIFRSMEQHGYLNWRVDVQALTDSTAELSALPLEQQKALLLECLDKNMLHVPLSEADSREFTLSPTDRELNRSFYKQA